MHVQKTLADSDKKREHTMRHREERHATDWGRRDKQALRRGQTSKLLEKERQASDGEERETGKHMGRGETGK